MEQLITVLQSIAESLNNDAVPIWVMYLSSLGPVILTAITAYLAWKQHQQNQQLQKDIANREYANMLRQNMLDIYNAHFEALHLIKPASDNVPDLFSSPNSFIAWSQALDNAYAAIIKANNQARLMIADDDLLTATSKCQNALGELLSYVSDYIQKGLPMTVIQNAWNTIFAKYGIPYNDYYTLSLNLPAKEEFWKLCENRHTQEIQKRMKAFIETLDGDQFDIHFKKYIQIPHL